MTAPLLEALASLQPHLVSLRHDIHRYPEPGFEEERTQARIREELEAVGLEPRDCAGTGLVVDIGSGTGPTIALRADIDCLRMTEENHDLPWRSQREGLAHMCGHDGHTTAMVGVAKLLAPHADKLPGRIRLLFQPAEEGPGGAPVMIEQGCLDGVDEVYGMHNWPAMGLGTLQTIAGPCMATVASFTITIKGKGGHASQPQDARDPVLAASQVVSALQSIVSRSVHYEERAVVSVTTFHAGEAFNVIPDTAVLTGTTRALSEEVCDLIERRMGEVVTQVAAGMGCEGALDFVRMYPVLVNTPVETAHVERAARAVLGEGAVTSTNLPMLGAEDFAYFLQHRPGCFFFLGGGEPGRSNSMCHATDYDFNDRLLAPAIQLWVRLVEDRLGVELYG